MYLVCIIYYTYMWDFSEITIIARNTDVKGISAVLETLQGTIGEDGEEGAVKFAVCEVADGEDVGSADALRTLKGRVKVRELRELYLYPSRFLI